VNAARNPVVLATGGTGGHIFPAQALAVELRQRDHGLVLITDRRGFNIGSSIDQIETYRVQAAGVSGRGLAGRLSATAQLGIGLAQAYLILRRLRPAAVVGFGSYASVPSVLAASFLSIPTVIHEQNAVLGRANRFLARRATRVATAFESVSELGETQLQKATWTGNPVRPDIVGVRNSPYPSPGKEGPLRLLVTGGSQGAHVFSTVVPAALATLNASLRARLHVSQHCRPEDQATVSKAYRDAGIDCDVSTFFDDMAERLTTTHLLICRAGASTMAELTTAGRPAILVPYPHAIDDHQSENAARLCDAGGGWMIQEESFTPEVLSNRLNSLLSPPAKLDIAARCAAKIGMPDAATRLAELVTGLIGTNGANVRSSSPAMEAMG
jgi:UDP-N-acetylglucosamine--N-acetylmuramyl-(pentapeptide) pyrophosphoryl-undecaprenol N-acetylglucosamine transferase